ncbi:MAG TPA: DUF418 domain-containing protein [Cellvibrionaceae bacterium]
MQSHNNNRIHAVDALRGFALAGITLAHMLEQFIASARPPQEIWGVAPTVVDEVLQAVGFLLISGKFFSIFALLFGISFAIMMVNAEKRGQAFVGRFVWRLTLLFAIGLGHALFYRGDILTVYAVIGLSLPLFYRLPDRVLWLLALLLFAGFGRAMFFLITGTDTLLPFAWTPESPVVADYIHTLKHGSLLDVFALNFTQGLATKYDFQLAVGSRGYLTLAYFLVGIWLVRSGIVGDIANRRQAIKKTCLYAAGAAVVFLLLTIGSFVSLPQPVNMTSWHFVLGMAFYDLLGVALTATLISVFLWLYLKRPKGKLNALSPYGRMALSNYVMQTLIGTFIFYGWGLGLLGKLHEWQTLLLAFVIIYGQIKFSAWWLSHYRYGPLEWV